MPLGLVLIQQRPHLAIQPRGHMGQALRQFLVNGGLGDAEFLRGGADGRPVFDDINSQIAGPIL